MRKNWRRPGLTADEVAAFRARVKAELEASGMTQVELGKRAKFRQSQISAFLNNKQGISLASANRIALALGIDTADFTRSVHPSMTAQEIEQVIGIIERLKFDAISMASLIALLRLLRGFPETDVSLKALRVALETAKALNGQINGGTFRAILAQMEEQKKPTSDPVVKKSEPATVVAKE